MIQFYTLYNQTAQSSLVKAYHWFFCVNVQKFLIFQSSGESSNGTLGEGETTVCESISQKGGRWQDKWNNTDTVDNMSDVK